MLSNIMKDDKGTIFANIKKSEMPIGNSRGFITVAIFPDMSFTINKSREPKEKLNTSMVKDELNIIDEDLSF